MQKNVLVLDGLLQVCHQKDPNLKKNSKNVKYLKIDITNKNKLLKINKNFDYIVNLAGYVDHTNKKKTIEKSLYWLQKSCIYFFK